MRQERWQRMLTTAVLAAALASGAAWADPPTSGDEQTIVLREPGKPDRKCLIEKSIPQPDGTVLHEVRDMATGEKMRVLDQRRNKGSVGTVTSRVTAPAAMTKKEPRLPTTAELAGQPATSASSNSQSTSRPAIFARKHAQ